MRIRTIKPEFWSHPVLSRLSDHARLLAIGLLTYADDEGYFMADEVLVRNALRPFDKDCGMVAEGLAALAVAGFIRVVVHPERGALGVVINFTKHQRISHPTPSRIKPYWPSGMTPELFRKSSAPAPEVLRPDQGSGNRDQGAREGGTGKGTWNARALLNSFLLDTSQKAVIEWSVLARAEACTTSAAETMDFLEWAIPIARSRGKTVEYARHCLAEAAEWKSTRRSRTASAKPHSQEAKP